MKLIIFNHILIILIFRQAHCNPVKEESKELLKELVTELKAKVEERIEENKQDENIKEKTDDDDDFGKQYGSSGYNGGNPCKSCPTMRSCTNGYNQILSAGLQENYAQESEKELLAQLEFLLRCSECISYRNGMCYANNGGTVGGSASPEWGGANPEWGGANPEWGVGKPEWNDWNKKPNVPELNDRVQVHDEHDKK